MRTLPRAAAAAMVLSLLVAGTRAQDARPAIQNAARCATAATTSGMPGDAPRIVAAQDSSGRTLFGTRDLVVISSGTARGMRVGQQFLVRRSAAFGDRHASGPRGVATAGWLSVVAVNEITAIARVDFACDGIFSGDYLEPYADLQLPDAVDRPDTTGQLDFANPARILFGDNERRTAGIGDFMTLNRGTRQGVAAGARFAIYRDMHLTDVPLTWVGEAVTVRSDDDTAIVRITNARDAVEAGDLAVRRQSSVTAR